VTCARCGDVHFGPAPPADGVEQYYRRERRAGVYRLIRGAFVIISILFATGMLALFYSILPTHGWWTYVTIALALAATAVFAWIGSRLLDRVFAWLVTGR
jgi:VIT1/CCC1 family predicted Fe2+/Mn2+ transporter